MPSHLPAHPQPAQRIQILVADRDRMGSQLLAESLGRDPHFEILGVAAAADIFPIAARKPDVSLISVEFEAGAKKGLQVARTLNAVHPGIHVVILLEESTRESVIASFRCGATGVFCRTDPISELHNCIEHVNRGEIWAGRDQAQYLLDALRNTPSCDGIEDGKLRLLTKRELEVAEHAAQGQSNKQIANELNLSEHTIKNYLFRVFEKLGVSSRFELLFLLFNERHNPLVSPAANVDAAGLNHPIETYLKAAEEGFIAAQYLVGLAHLEGCGMEKNGRSAYYWLRMAEENSYELRQRALALTEELKSKIRADELETLEHRVMAVVEHNRRSTAKRPVEFIKRSTASASLRIAM
ncbi:MAG: LuxR C-terminal-related transcriptional regulator [Candidatus Sulfotelmatobacter sp.]